MKKIVFALLIGMFGFSPFVRADTPAPNQPVRINSANGQSYIEMKPQEGWGGYGAGKGTAYKIDEKGTADELWSVDFYASQAVLTNDGRHLIVFGPWASELTDLAIAFYQDGREMKKYSIQDLIRDESKLDRTVSHFFWRRDTNDAAAGLSQDEKEYSLTLIDGSVYVFEVASGKILPAD